MLALAEEGDVEMEVDMEEEPAPTIDTSVQDAIDESLDDSELRIRKDYVPQVCVCACALFCKQPAAVS